MTLFKVGDLVEYKGKFYTVQSVETSKHTNWRYSLCPYKEEYHFDNDVTVFLENVHLVKKATEIHEHISIFDLGVKL